VELSDAQRQAVAQWVEEGFGLSDIQKRLNTELDVSMTYMDLRFLVLDLGLQVKDKEQPKVDSTDLGPGSAPGSGAGSGAAAPPAGGGSAAADLSASPGGGSVAVDVDRLTKPGCVVSGNVTFSDGVSANWSLDQAGRLAIEATQPGYRPSPEDIQAFQDELRKALETRGF